MTTELKHAVVVLIQPLSDLLGKLYGNTSDFWWRALLRFVAGVDRPFLLTSEDRWHALKIREGRSVQKLIEECEAASCEVTELVKKIFEMSALTTVGEKEDALFVMGTEGSLFGLTELPDESIFLNDAYLSRFGLEFCKPTDAFDIRLAHLSQKDKEDLTVASSPIQHDGTSYFLTVTNYDKLRVHCTETHAGIASSGKRWVFRLKEQSK